MCASQSKGLRNKYGNLLLQLIATISGCVSVMGFGLMVGWSSPSIPYLTSKDSELPISVVEGAWITSVTNLGTILGLVLLPFLVNRLGRKHTILLYGACQIISWLFIIFSNSFFTLCFGRIISGYGSGGSLAAVSIYLGEITEKKIRGMLSSLIVVFSDFGIFIVATFGSFFTFDTMNLLILSIPLLHIATFVFMPETPYFYLMQDQEEKAAISLKRLRGAKDEELEFEMEEMKTSVAENTNSNNNSLKHLFYNKSNLKALLIVLTASFASLSSGSIAMIAYCQDIFSLSGFPLIKPTHSFMIIVAVKIIAGLAVSQFVERIGRRTLFLFSGVSCATAQGVVGLFFFMKYYLKYNVSSFSWLPLASLISFHITAAVGIGPIPYILMSELFSIQIKQVAVPISVIFTCIVSFSTELMFPLINKDLGNYVSFWIFGTCCFFGTVLLFYILPETRGKSLEEIQSILNSKK